MKHYTINEVFYTLQGEGRRAGEASVFVRFSHCNLTCRLETEGFACDTEFASGQKMTLVELNDALRSAVAPHGADGFCKWIVWTGGEPALQVDQECVDFFKGTARSQAIETSGTRELPDGLDWVCVSPKTAEHTLRVTKHIDELKYVRNAGQGIPKPSLKADHYLLSPAFGADGFVDAAALRNCVELCKHNQKWKLSLQQHKAWGVR